MDLQTQLLQVARALKADEVASLVFLCTDLLRRDLQSVYSAKELFTMLMDQGFLSAEQPDLLVELLDTIRRWPLIRELNFGDLLPRTSSLISSYRYMLYDLSENITQDELKEIKFLLTDRLPRGKLESMTTLEVFLELEHKDFLSNTKLDLLNTIIKKVCPMLKKKIDQFVSTRENSPVSEQTHFDQTIRWSASNTSPGHQDASSREFGSESVAGAVRNTESLDLLQSSFNESNSTQNISLDQQAAVGTLSETLERLTTRGDNASAISQGTISSRADRTLGPGRSQTANTASDVPVGPNSKASIQTRPSGLETYPIRKGKMGFCLIINNEDFSSSRPLSNRKGTQVDEESLVSVFQWLGFQILIERNCTRKRMLSVLHDLATKDHRQMDCLVCCVLSHGLEGSVYGVDGATVQLKEITKPFNGLLSSTLKGKPKMFFVQACQGTGEQQPVFLESDSTGPRYDHTGDSLCCDASVPKDSIASDADFILGMATVPDNASFRDIKRGTWYIQSLCENLIRMVPSGEDLVSILTKVNDDVSRKSDDFGSRKQMPQPAFSLRKRVVFPIPDEPHPSPSPIIKLI